MYSFLYTLFLLFFIPIYAFVIKKKGYSIGLKERLTLYKGKKLNRTLWFHCSSVGELNTAKPLIEYYSSNYEILITVSSPRGKEYALKSFKDFEVRYLPFDYRFLIRRFLRKYRPEMLLILEGEFWYNFITESSKSISLISVNTRVSHSSYKFYKRLRFFYKKIFNSISKFLVRSEYDKDFLEEFIDDKSKIVVCGDLKFVSSGIKKDVYLDKDNKIVFIAGSTHEPEEEIILSVYKRLKEDFPELVLILAPRHLERLDDIKKLIESYGFEYSLRSQTKKLENDVYLVDTLGELAGLYRYADVVFVGGTIADVGGHNILEPALENKPVIIGNNYYKIKELYDMLKDYHIVFSVEDEEELHQKIKNILSEGFKINVDFKSLQEEIRKCYIDNINTFLKEKR